MWFSGSENLSLELSSVEAGSDVHYIESQQIDTDSKQQNSRVSPQNDSSPKDPISINTQLSDPQIRLPLPNGHLHPSVQPQPLEQNHSDHKKMEEKEKERDEWDLFFEILPNIMDPIQSNLQMSHTVIRLQEMIPGAETSPPSCQHTKHSKSLLANLDKIHLHKYVAFFFLNIQSHYGSKM